MKNVILDRFPVAGINEFTDQLEDDIKVKVVITLEEKPIPNEVTECYSSLSLSKGVGIEFCPWVMGRKEIEYFSKYEGLFLSMLSRCDVYKDSFTTEEMLEHYNRLINFWLHKLNHEKIK